MPRTQQIPGAAPLLLEKHLAELGLKFVKEYAFALPRKWRFDYVLDGFVSGCALLIGRVAIEIEGGIWVQGRHTRGCGYLRDLEKYREAAAANWRVYRFSTGEVLNGTAREFISKHCL